MRSETINIFKFSELSENASKKAIEWYRSGRNDEFYQDEIIETVKKVAKLFNLKFGNEYTDIRYSNIDNNILELSGVRLYKYIINNYYNELFAPKYIKMLHRELKCKQFICEVGTNYKGDKYTQLFSKLHKTNCCTLTGVCYDNDILKPVYDFLLKPTNGTTLEDLIQSIEHAIDKCFTDTENWVNSDEYIIDTIEANEYEFTEDGKRYK